jgi:endoglucanase
VFFGRVDYAVDAALSRGMRIVINMHHYRQLDGDALDRHETAVEPSVVETRFLNLWRQIAARYAGRSNQLLFEIYNEPHSAQNNTWNERAAQALSRIRITNPTRLVVIGPVSWNNARALSKLTLPNDPHLIVTVHHYAPFEFTHQGASWAQGSDAWVGKTCCDAAQTEQIVGALDVAKAWSDENKYPVWLGEFGAYERAPMESRVNFTRLMRDSAEARGFAWSYWEFGSGFGAYDPRAQAWREPLRDALLGPKNPDTQK